MLESLNTGIWREKEQVFTAPDSEVICVLQKAASGSQTVMADFQQDIQASVFSPLWLCQHRKVWEQLGGVISTMARKMLWLLLSVQSSDRALFQQKQSGFAVARVA